MKRLLTISLFFISIAVLFPASALARTPTFVFKGKIAGKNVKVELYTDTDDYSKVHGSYYYYDNNGKKLSSVLTLKGDYEDGRAMSLMELTETYNGKYCGKWYIEVDHYDNPKKWEGTLTNSKGKKYKIMLRQVN